MVWPDIDPSVQVEPEFAPVTLWQLHELPLGSIMGVAYWKVMVPERPGTFWLWSEVGYCTPLTVTVHDVPDGGPLIPNVAE